MALVLAAMVLLALRAERRLAAHVRLPMQFGLTLRPTAWAPRRVALGLLPGLAVAVSLGLAAVFPGTQAALVAAAALLGGQVFYHALVVRAL